MLIENTLFGERNKVKTSIDRLRAYEPKEGYYVAFSGGKDSQTIYHLAEEAGVKFEAHYNLTTVDPPELVYFIKDNYPNVIIDYPKKSMWQLIIEHRSVPTRLLRFCCAELKEKGGEGRFTVTGVRWAESIRRKNTRAMLELNNSKGGKNTIFLNEDNDRNRMLIETCKMRGKHVLNPIIDWKTEDVWEYLNSRNIKHCCLYDEGFSRLGCIGCPNGNTKGMLREFKRYPKYKANYIRAFNKMLKSRNERGMATFPEWTSGEAVMKWWIGGGHTKDYSDSFLNADNF